MIPVEPTLGVGAKSDTITSVCGTLIAGNVFWAVRTSGGFVLTVRGSYKNLGRDSRGRAALICWRPMQSICSW